ncbi:MAG: hypothetical protein AAFP98_00960 [Pseudomonadota bacterium]
MVHVTAASNVPLIMEHGLMPAATLAELAGVTPDRLAMRHVRRKIAPPFGMCVLNHQKPILDAGDAPERTLDGYTGLEWAAQLDQRVFFAPAKQLDDFKASVAKDLPIAEITVSTEGLLEACGDEIELAPINTGNFRQGGAHAARGDWIYVPATAGLPAFRKNRAARGLVKTPDSVKEISMRGTVPPNVLNAIAV